MNTNKAVLQVLRIFLKVITYVLIILGIFCLGKVAYTYSHAVLHPEAMEEAPGRSVSLEIKQDATQKQLAEFLEKNGLIESAGVFRLQMKVLDFDDTVKAGKYRLNTSMTPEEMLEILSGSEEDSEQ